MLATDPDLLISQHAEERMWERDITMRDVLSVLRTGEIIGQIAPGKNDKEWICKVVATPRYPNSKREVGVVTVVMRGSRLLIATVEWEDRN